MEIGEASLHRLD